MTVIDLTAPAPPGGDPTRAGRHRAMIGGAAAGAALVLAYSIEELLRRGPLLRLDTVVENAVPRPDSLRGLAAAVT
ncbi:MAG: hypothetical protein H7323_11050, partial [Frankiales bacterium]|nr:hypothetical protein [Frankiales bacterium]